MKWSVTTVCLLVLMTSAPLGAGQGDAHTVEDSAGDVSYIVADEQSTGTTPASDHGRADILWLDVVETDGALSFTTTVADVEPFPPGSGQWVDAASLDVRFQVGELFYNARTGMYQDGNVYGELRGGQSDYSEPVITSDLEATQDGASFTVTVPRDLLRDHNGAPVQKGMQLTELHVDSHVHATGIFLQNQDGSLMQPLGIRDRMPDDGGVSVDIFLGGPASNGPIKISSVAPFRASNGGAGTFRYDLTAVQTGPGEPLFDLVFKDVPASWTVERPPGLLRLPSGVPAEFPILVTTPFGHQHGGTEEFTFSLVGHNDTDVWASLELGMHYVTPPQPSGHHPTMWFHSTPYGEPGRTLNTVNGGVNGATTMNTIEDDDADQKANVQGWTGGATSSAFRWSVCMTPDLRMGIDVNMSKTGEVVVPLQSDRDYSDVVVSGRVLHLGPGDEVNTCWFGNYDDREQTEIATIPDSEPMTISSTTNLVTLPVTPESDGDYIPFETGTMLVLELFATPAQPAVAGPESINLVPGGQITLPLDEYHDARPQGLIGLPTSEAEAPAEDEAFVPDAETKEAPSAPLGASVIALAAAVVLRRRT